jgi:hypothetical protein
MSAPVLTASAAAPAWMPADPSALQAALRATGGARVLPDAGMREYLYDLARWLQGAVVGWVGRALPWARLPALERWLVYGAVTAAATVVVLLVVMAWRRRRRRQATTDAAQDVEATTLPARPPGDARHWQQELRRRLAAGELRPALRAAWWWAARTLAPAGLDPSWTSADLLRATGRPPLRAALGGVDRLLWGAREPAAEEVERAVDELARALGPRGTPGAERAGERGA